MEERESQAKSSARLVYVLYLVGLVTGGVTVLVGVVVAYLNRQGAPQWIGDHVSFQTRTFWIGMLYSVIGAVLTPVLIGFLVLAVVLVWYIVRCVKGFQSLDRGEPPSDVETWGV